MNLPVVFLALAGTLLLAPATRAAELRWEPVRGRVGYADNRGVTAGSTAGWKWIGAGCRRSWTGGWTGRKPTKGCN